MTGNPRYTKTFIHHHEPEIKTNTPPRSTNEESNENNENENEEKNGQSTPASPASPASPSSSSTERKKERRNNNRSPFLSSPPSSPTPVSAIVAGINRLFPNQNNTAALSSTLSFSSFAKTTTTTTTTTPNSSKNNSDLLMAAHVKTPAGLYLARKAVKTLDTMLFTRQLGSGAEAAVWKENEMCWMCDQWRSHTILSHNIQESKSILFATPDEKARMGWRNKTNDENEQEDLLSSSSCSSSSSSESDEEDGFPRIRTKPIIPERKITMLYPHHCFTTEKTMKLDPGSESSPRYHLSALLPNGRTIFFFRNVSSASSSSATAGAMTTIHTSIYCVDVSQPTVAAPVWIQRRYRLSHVNYYDMLPPKKNNHLITFDKEDSFFASLLNCDITSLVDVLRRSNLWNRLSLSTVMEIIDDDEKQSERNVLNVLQSHTGMLLACYQYGKMISVVVLF